MPSDAPPAVRVRMYRQGFGDCFLLRFTEGAETRHVLIDCGAHTKSRDRKKRMTETVKSILKETGGKLAVLVATHEHVDHVSAFESDEQQSQLNALSADQTWLAWTEDPRDPAAKRIKRELTAARLQLAAALKAPSLSPTLRDALDHVAGFEFNAAGGGGTDTAMKWLRDDARHPRFLRPFQEPLSIPGISGVRVFVLGPPLDSDILRSTDPRKDEGYARLALSSALRAAARPPGTVPDSSEWTPFDCGYLPRTEATSTDPADPALRNAKILDDIRRFYDAPENAHRRIDGAWEGAVPELALRIGRYINNTSLVLAFEIVATGDVLFFAADAQAGNCRSWSAGAFSIGGRSVTAADLLRRTVLYKVSHHASHNGTLKAAGLELMTSPKLTAMVPLMGDPLGDKWHMPAKGLIRRLRELCEHRVIVSDFQRQPVTPPAAPGSAWNKFLGQIKIDPLWIDWNYAP